MTVYYVIAKNGQKYYYQDGVRITAEEGKRLGARRKSEGKAQSRKKSSKVSRRGKSLKPCKSHQVRDPVTNRCRNKSGRKRPSPKKSSRRKSSKASKRKDGRVPCKSHQYRDPDTGRCRNKASIKRDRRRSSHVPCKSHQVRDPVTGRCVNKSDHKRSRVRRDSKTSRAPCKSHQYRDPDTGRCRNKASHVRDRKRSSRVPCKSHQVRDPVTGRCMNKSGHKRERSHVREPVKRDVHSKRYKRSKKITGNCVKRSKLPLRDLQLKVVEFMEKNDGLLVVHGTGSGKTLTAITATQCYLDKHPSRGIVFVGPASLISNFKKEMNAYGVKNSDKYEFYSYDKFMIEDKADRPISLKNKFLVVDEAHNMRNPVSKKSLAVVHAALEADKRLLLTATPFVNSLTDFIPLINMVYGKMLVGTRKQFYEDETDEWLGKEINDANIATFRYLLEDKVDVVDCKDPKDFPERIDHYIDVPMQPEYYKRYVRLVHGEGLFGILFRNPDAFYNGYRRAVNRAGPEYYSRKINSALPILKKGHTIIYTNWVDFGIRPITDALKKNGITFKTFFGDVPKSERQDMIDEFNDDQFEVLILTKAGGEGIDLKGVRSVIVLDPPWNDAGLQQVVGRAIRYKSHAHLPASQRKVNVYFMVLTHPENLASEDAEPSGDKLLYAIIDKKNEISTVLHALLAELSI